MIFNEIKCHVNTSLGLVGGWIPCMPLCVRAWVLPRPADTGWPFGALAPKAFVPPSFVVLSKIWFEHMMKTKIFPPNNVFCPPTLKPGYEPVSAKNVSAIRIFCFEGHSVSRCSITLKPFL